MKTLDAISARAGIRPSHFRLLLAGSLIVTTVAGLPLAQAGAPAHQSATGGGPHVASTPTSITWSPVYRNDFTSLSNVDALQSSSTTNTALSPQSTANLQLREPTLASNVVAADDPLASDGKSMAVWTRQGNYQTSTGTRYGWTNGHAVLTGQNQTLPVRIQARVRMTASAETKSAVMWSPTSGWPWDVHFAETFGGSSLSDYWGSRQHIAQRWYGGRTGPYGLASQQLAHDDTIDATKYHVYDLFITPTHMWVQIDGVQTFSTTNAQFIPTSAGYFNVGKALTNFRAAADRTHDAVFVDWLEIYKPAAPPLAAPTGLQATASSHAITLAWTPNTETDLAGYNVYRANAAAGPYTKLSSPLVTSAAYTDSVAPVGATSYYRVTALNTSGNESAGSATASAAMPSATPPSPPTGLSAATTATGVALTWTANAESDLAGYHVYRSTSATGAFTDLTPTSITAPSYLDISAGASKTYYRVTAVNTSGNESPPSAVVSAPGTSSGPFSLIFQDDFLGGLSKTWSIFHGAGNGTNGPKATANTFTAGGSMVLRAAPINGTWYGAGICACGVVQTYGKYEMRVRFDAGYGVKTAAMLWPANGGWPPEVDFYEISEADPTRTTNVLTNHWRDATGTHMEHGLSRGNFTQWHVVGVEWTPSALNFTLDGVVVKTMTSHVPNVPMWFGMNVSLGPPGVRPNTSTPSHVDADIDWVKIYRYTG